MISFFLTKIVHAAEEVGLKSPLKEIDIPAIIGMVLKGFLMIAGVFALLFFVWAGIQWMTSGGEEEKIKAAKANMLWTVLGVIALLVGWIVFDQVLKLVRQ